MLSIVSILDVRSIIRNAILDSGGDHITVLNIFRGCEMRMEKFGNRRRWGRENGISLHSMHVAAALRQKCYRLMMQLGIDSLSTSLDDSTNSDNVREVFTSRVEMKLLARYRKQLLSP